MWIEIEYKNYEPGVKSIDPTIYHAIINSDMITEIHIEDKTIKGYADLYYELTDRCFKCFMENLVSNKNMIKMYTDNDFDVDDFVDKLSEISSKTTQELVEQLSKRQGVRKYNVLPYTKKIISTVGPSIILIVDD